MERWKPTAAQVADVIRSDAEDCGDFVECWSVQDGAVATLGHASVDGVAIFEEGT